MLKSEIRLLTFVEAEVTECPLWDGQKQQLHFVDIYGNRIVSLDWQSGVTSQIELPEAVSCVALTETHHFIIGLKSGTALVDRTSGKVKRHGTISIAEGCRLNDGRCDPEGRHFWVGSMVENLEHAGGHLYCVGTDGGTRTMAADLICSNGLAWSPDGSVMYHSDSRQRTVWAYDYDTDLGTVSDKRVFCVANEGEGRPDGAAVDAAGCYWSARYDGWRIVRHAPDGSKIFVLKTPVQNPTMCAFAGSDLSTLVFTSARGSLTPDELERQPLAGSVFAVDVDVAGCAEPHFKTRT
jgi:sugar lactone lactonase YvrE